MDKKTLLSKLNEVVPGAVLRKQRMGRSEMVCLWIETKSIQRVAEIIKQDNEISLDWLENLSAMQIGEALVFTYVVSSWKFGSTLILRGSADINVSGGIVSFPSVTKTWPMAIAFESEIEELFGVSFQDGTLHKKEKSLLLHGWVGFPLRKDYVFPKQVLGISHCQQVTSNV